MVHEQPSEVGADGSPAISKSPLAEAERIRALPYPDGIEEPEWMELDRGLFIAMHDLLPPPPSSEDLRRRLRDHDFELDAFGGESEPALGTALERYERHGGYSSCSVSVHLFDDEPTRVVALCAPSSTTAGVFAYAEEALRGALTRQDGVLRAQFDWEAREAARNQRRAEVLGAAGSVRPTSELRDAYERLVDPGPSLVYGTLCGYAGAPPYGREALEPLVVAGSVDLLRQALRGPNPGGRLYAAEGLIRLEALSTADEEAIAASSSATVSTCGGCIVSDRPFHEAYATVPATIRQMSWRSR